MESLPKKIFAIQQNSCILIQFPVHNIMLPYNSYAHTGDVTEFGVVAGLHIEAEDDKK
jgi:hypothetical protein